MLSALTGAAPLISAYPSQKRVVFMGTSLTARAFENLTTSQTFYNRAFPAWVKFLTGGRVTIDLADNFGVDSSTMAQIASRVPAALARKPDFAIIDAGTNEPNGTTLAQMQAGLLSIIKPMLNAGVTCIVLPIAPRAVSTIPSNFKQQFANYNAWLRTFVAGQQLQVTSRNRTGLYLADAVPWLTDKASANGEGLSDRYNSDGIHFNAYGAYFVGRAIADVLNQLVPPIPLHPQANGDYFDATWNPRGNILHSTTTNQGTLAGTGGAQTVSTGVTYAGTNPASGFHVQRLAGTSTCTMTTTKVARTDAAGGDTQRIQIVASTTGLAVEQFQFRFQTSPTVGLAGATDIQVGDTLWGGVGLSIASHTGLIAMSIELESDPTGGNRYARDMFRHPTESIVMPPGPIAGQLRTPPLVIASGATVCRWRVYMDFKADAQNIALDANLYDAWMRKVI